MIWSELVERGNITIPDVIRVVHDNLPRRRVTREIHAFFRMILHRRSFRKLCDLFSRPEFRYIGDIEPAIFYKPFRPYFCKGLPIRKRIDQIYFHYETLGSLYRNYIRRLYSSGGIPVLTLQRRSGEEPEYHVILHASSTFRREAELAFSVVDATDMRMYSAAFSFVKDGDAMSLAITSIQGCDPSAKDPQGALRTITRQAFGLIPMHLVTDLVFMFARACGARRVIAVKTSHHVFQDFHYKKLSRKVYCDYDAIWAAFGAKDCGIEGFSEITEEPRKDLASIPSKKRSLYRKRYALLDGLDASVQKLFAVKDGDAAGA